MPLMTEPHKDQIRKFLYEMTQTMIPDGVLTILRGSSFTLHDEEYVNAGSTRIEKVDRLLNRVLLKGDEVFYELVAALRRTSQNNHANMLDPTPVQPTPVQPAPVVPTPASDGVAGATSQIQPSTNHNQFPEVSPLNARDGPRAIENLQVATCSETFYRLHSPNAYPMHKMERGLAVIINVQTVVGMDDRIGTDIDRDHLKQLFEQFHFVVKVFNNPTAKVMRNELEEVRKDKDLMGRAQCFVLCVLSHGEITKTGTISEEVVYGSDGRTVPTSDIFEYFDNVNCPALVGKPRVVVFQACRVEVTAANAPDRGTLTDFIICYPTEKGCSAWRNKEAGGWYINYVVQEFIKNAHREDICALLNGVNGALKQALKAELPEAQQVSSFTSYLTKAHLYFFPGFTSNNP